MSTSNTLQSRVPFATAQPPLDISRRTWDPDKNRHSLDITVGDGAKWVVSKDDEKWLSIDSSVISAGRFTLNVDENDTGVSRASTVTVTFNPEAASPTTATITVTQAPVVWKKNSITPNKVILGKGESYATIYVTAANAWNMRPRCSWLSLMKPVFTSEGQVSEYVRVGSGIGTVRPSAESIAAGRDKITLAIHVDANNTGMDRTTKMELGNVFDIYHEAVVEVVQLGGNPTIGYDIPDTVSIEADVEAVMYPVSPTAPFSVSSSAEWLDASFTFEEGKPDSVFLELKCEKNEASTARTATVTVTPTGDVVSGMTAAEITACTSTITVTQAAATVTP